MVDVVYSWLPPKCGTCGQLGHKATRCLGLPPSQSLPQATEVAMKSNTTSVPTAESISRISSPAQSKCDLEPSVSEMTHVASEVTAPVTATATATEIDTIAFVAPTTSTITKVDTAEVDTLVIVTETNSTSPAMSFCSLTSEIGTPVLASTNTDPLVSQTATLTKDAPATKDSESEIDLSNSLESSVTPSHLTLNDQQSNSFPPPLLMLDAPLHVLGETSICTSEENGQNGVGVEGFQFAPLNQWISGPEIDYAQRSRGGRPIKPTQKAQEMQWTTVGGRGHRGRRGRGGRGHSL